MTRQKLADGTNSNCGQATNVRKEVKEKEIGYKGQLNPLKPCMSGSLRKAEVARRSEDT
ncbi:unnamed protein product [Hymenolepis diminuta]|uniref:Uncharacterized protein n=1 Tax=Hymenolepis diminuta TaxID=6216 RepID=A0A564YD90_HYMDI|nr:unnamed protein product [Hymenolepis diminuta]